MESRSTRPAVFVTGFPGFLASGLLPRVLARAPGARAACLVQPRFADLARERVYALEARNPALTGAIQLVEGDITRPDLGLGPARGAFLAAVDVVYHLAAVYDLTVARDVAMRVNVDGTRHVLAFAAECRAFQRLHYASTCYVSGRYEGRFTEAQLDEGQAFNNFYEESKYRAELLVRDAIANGLPATIFRPSIVVGDSRTGETQKYDGPYWTIRWLLRQPRLTILPLPAGSRETELNVVPCDFVLDSIAALAARADTAGQTFQLADPHPLKIPEMVHVLARETARRVVRIPVPMALARMALGMPGADRFAPVPGGMLDYTVHRSRYDTSATTRALEGTAIACPRFTDYAGRLVQFVRAHPEVRSDAMA